MSLGLLCPSTLNVKPKPVRLHHVNLMSSVRLKSNTRDDNIYVAHRNHFNSAVISLNHSSLSNYIDNSFKQIVRNEAHLYI